MALVQEDRVMVHLRMAQGDTEILRQADLEGKVVHLQDVLWDRVVHLQDVLWGRVVHLQDVLWGRVVHLHDVRWGSVALLRNVPGDRGWVHPHKLQLWNNEFSTRFPTMGFAMTLSPLTMSSPTSINFPKLQTGEKTLKYCSTAFQSMVTL